MHMRIWRSKMGRLFGTDGVRGVANQELTADLAFRLGQAGAYVLTKETHHQAKILVGMDTRKSGDMLACALMAGICSVGAKAEFVGVIPTPGIAYLTRKYGADAGVMISASHNPVEDNGIKFFNNEGYKLRDELEEQIEAILLDGVEELPQPIGGEVGDVTLVRKAVHEFASYLKSTVDVDFTGLKVAIDCANGAAFETAPLVLRQLGADVNVIHAEPDGININKDCGSTHMEALQAYVKEIHADVGFAFDGDADRCLAVDHEGNVIDGDQLMAICGLQMKKENTLKNNTIVATVMSNLGFHMMAKDNGLQLKTTKVGDRYVLEEMLRENYNIGGEQSGHIIFLDYNTTGDGILTALQVLKVLKKTGSSLKELAGVMQILPQVLINARVKNENKNSYMEDQDIAAAIEKLEEEFAGKGRVLIRPSGTEPLVRVMIEGEDQEVIQRKAEELAELIKSRLA